MAGTDQYNFLEPVGADPSLFAQYGNYSSEAAINAGIDPNWFNQLISNESAFNPNAQNPNSSANGIAQFTSGTANWLGINSSDPQQSLDAAAEYASNLYTLGLNNGLSSNDAYAFAAQKYGDTASNNPNATTFQSRLAAALGFSSAAGGASSPLAGANTVNPLSNLFSNFTGGASALLSNPVGTINSITPQQFLGGVTSVPGQVAGAATTAAGQAVSSVLAPAQGLINSLTNLFSQSTLERTIFIGIGLLLLAAAVFTLVKSYGSSPQVA